MMKLYLTLFTLMILNLVSCSTEQPTANIERFPASNENLVDEIFTIHKSTLPSKKDYKKDLDLMLNMYNNKRIQMILVPDANLPDSIAFKLKFEIKDNNYFIKIFHSNNAFNDIIALESLDMFITAINSSEIFINPYSIFEMVYNARLGDPEALQNLLKLRTKLKNFINPLDIDQTTTPEVVLQELEKETKSLNDKINTAVKNRMSERKKLKQIRKSLLDTLDKAPEENQLRTLIAKNDRKGFVNLIKKYLPYEEMAPLEKQFWDEYLDIVANPLPLHQRVFIYRGIDDDAIHAGFKDGVLLSKDEAFKEGNAFVMSTVIVKNQGTWNRRLRSLETMYDKNIATVASSNEFSRSARITTMFASHAGDPLGSPFLSLTPNIEVADQFGLNKKAAFLIDPRLLNFNFTSTFDNEREFLLLLATFPEDLVATWDSKTNPALYQKYFDEKLVSFIETKYGKADRDAIVEEINKNSYDFFNNVFKTKNKSPNQKIKYMGTASDFFKKFANSPNVPAPTFDIGGNLQCKDLLKTFWK